MANETKHTPGPWRAENHGINDNSTIYGYDEYKQTMIADVWPQGDDPDYPEGAIAEANTQLIAAAPELLEALARVPMPPPGFDTEDGCRKYAEVIIHWLDTTCAAAIAKATGEEVAE